MPELAELANAFLTLTHAIEQKDHYKTQPRKGGQFAEHGGGSSGGHKSKAQAKAKKAGVEPGKSENIFSKGGDEEEGGYYRQLPDGGVEWVESGSAETPSGGKPETGGGKQAGSMLTRPDGSRRPATVTDHNGVRIVTPDDLDAGAQSLTVDDARAFIDQVPAGHRDVFTEIRILDEPYRDKDGINDRAAATYYPETGVIEIHKNSHLPAQDLLRTTMAQTFRHEGAHALTDRLPKSFVTEWKKAVRKDGGVISDYARTNTHEDIAETVARYWSPDSTERRVVQRFFPERYALLLKYGIKPGG